MIIFFNKKTGKIIGTVDGRIHPKESKSWSINDSSLNKKDIDKMIIGWQETGEKEEITVKIGKKTVKETRTKMIEHNLNHFKTLQDIENDKTPTNIFDFEVDVKYNKLVRIKK